MAKITTHMTPWQQRFFEALDEPLALLELFELLPQIHMYIKDGEGRFVHVNRGLCNMLGADSQADVVGKNDLDFFPPAVATQYLEEDRRVMTSRKPLIDQVWLVPGYEGFPRWYISSKMPLYDHHRDVLGIAGVMRPYEPSGAAPAGHARLLKVVEFVAAHFGEPLEVGDLAKVAHLSVSQLQREFSRLFGITPNHYLRQVRIGVARHLLETGNDSMAQIAAHCGFYDQSHFSRQFKASTGLTPLQYRRRYNPPGAAGPVSP